MKFLTDEQRAKAIASLTRAPDEVILSAMVEFRRWRHMEEGTLANFNEVAGELAERRTHTAPVSEERRGTCGCAVQEVKLQEIDRPNVDPGKPAIGKIGAPAKALILEELSTGTIQPHAKYAEHLKLLWARGEVKFDGQEYYL